MTEGQNFVGGRKAFFLVLWLTLIASLAGFSLRAEEDPLQVLVTIPPQRLMVERIGGTTSK